ncbi:MAG: UDP-glucose 4-epimerase GalE [Candidatus Woesebacteria bacterium]|nr:UDP-glucose 4-epimerase GalE [Candidatus Woesebacteria bacterium]
MEKILVTGGAGYIGSFMVRRLKEKGFDVVIADNLSQGHAEAVTGYRLQVIDLVTEKEKLNELFEKEKFSGVVHMASFIQMGESFKNPSKYFQNNLMAALNVMDAMAKNKVNNFILSSSAGVYGNPESLPIKESDKREPLNPYGETKYMIEKMLEWYDKAYGLKFMAIRYFNAAGGSLDGEIGEDHPDESHLIPLVIKAGIKSEKFTIFGNDYKTEDGTCIRDYIHVLDLVETHEIALRKLLGGSQSNFYNVGVGRGYSNNEVVEMVRKVTGLAINVDYGSRREGDADSLYASIDKIKKDFNWCPKYSLEDIIKTAYEWHKNHPNGYGSPK